MPKLHEETYGGGDQTWLASDHGMFNARSYTLTASAFTAEVTKFGKVPSGLPVALADGALVPYTGSEAFAGHILFDVDGKFDNSVAVLIHGFVHQKRVPTQAGTFTVPAQQSTSAITYVDATTEEV